MTFSDMFNSARQIAMVALYDCAVLTSSDVGFTGPPVKFYVGDDFIAIPSCDTKILADVIPGLDESGFKIDIGGYSFYNTENSFVVDVIDRLDCIG